MDMSQKIKMSNIKRFSASPVTSDTNETKTRHHFNLSRMAVATMKKCVHKVARK